jgi:hypothetical protein
MNCCQCQGLETLFNEQYVTKELSRYRNKGPEKTTRLLIDALKAEGVQGMALLDIGGGVGVIQHELLFYRLRRIPFRVFVHPTQEVEAVVSRQGLKRRFYRQTLIWQVVVYAR